MLIHIVEEQAVELFAANLLEAGSAFLDNPGERPFIPSWNRVRAAIPDLPERIVWSEITPWRSRL